MTLWFDSSVMKETWGGTFESDGAEPARHEGGTHGKRLMDNLADLFGARLSPGTVYPRLHEMEAKETVTVHEMVRTKEYTIADEEGARQRVRHAMNQHLAVGLFLQHALDTSEF